MAYHFNSYWEKVYNTTEVDHETVVLAAEFVRRIGRENFLKVLTKEEIDSLTPLNELFKLNPPNDMVQWVNKNSFKDPQELWDSCPKSDWLLQIMKKSNLKLLTKHEQIDMAMDCIKLANSYGQFHNTPSNILCSWYKNGIKPEVLKLNQVIGDIDTMAWFETRRFLKLSTTILLLAFCASMLGCAFYFSGIEIVQSILFLISIYVFVFINILHAVEDKLPNYTCKKIEYQYSCILRKYFSKCPLKPNKLEPAIKKLKLTDRIDIWLFKALKMIKPCRQEKGIK